MLIYIYYNYDKSTMKFKFKKFRMCIQNIDNTLISYYVLLNSLMYLILALFNGNVMKNVYFLTYDLYYY